MFEEMTCPACRSYAVRVTTRGELAAHTRADGGGPCGAGGMRAGRAAEALRAGQPGALAEVRKTQRRQRRRAA